MLKASIWDGTPVWRFGYPKTSKSKLLPSRGMAPGWLDAKSFDLGWPPGLEVWRSKNVQIEAFTIQGHGPRMLKPWNSRFWGPKTSNSKVLTSWGHLSGCMDAKTFDLGWPPGLEVWESKPPNRGGIPNRSFYHPGAWPQDVKSFEFEVLGSKNSKV